MDRVVSSAIDLCTFIYMGVGIAGYLAFADTNFTGASVRPFPIFFLANIFFFNFRFSLGNILISFTPSLVSKIFSFTPSFDYPSTTNLILSIILGDRLVKSWIPCFDYFKFSSLRSTCKVL